MEDVCKIIKSILVTSKDGIPIENINREYREIVGENIAYRDFNASNLREFLNQIPNLRFYQKNGSTIVEVIPTAATAHIAAMVARQKTSKKKRKPQRLPSFRSYQSRSSCQPYYSVPSYFNSYEQSTYPTYNNYNRQILPRIDNRTSKSTTSTATSMRNESKPSTTNSFEAYRANLLNKYNNRNADKASKSSEASPNSDDFNFEYPENKSTLKACENKNGYNSNYDDNRNQVLRDNGEIKRESVDLNSNTIIQPVELKISDDANTFFNQNPQLTSQTFTNCYNDIMKEFNDDYSNSISEEKSSVFMDSFSCTKNSLKDILKKPKLNRQYEESSLPYTPPDSPPINLDASLEDPRLTLMNIAKRLNLSEPKYTSTSMLGASKSKEYYGKVSLGLDHNYKSFPTPSKSENEAHKLAAEIALESLRNFCLSFDSLMSEDDKELVKQNIISLIYTRPNGVFESKMNMLYLETYKQPLPSNWKNIVDECPFELVREEGIKSTDNVQYIIRKFNPDIDQCEMKEQKLPEDMYWYVFINYVASSAEIWGILHNDLKKVDEIEEQFRKLLFSMENPARNIKENKFYAYKDTEDNKFRRVKVQKILRCGTKAEVHYIDSGHSKHVLCDDLYELHHSLYEYPPLAFQLSLVGLEDFYASQTTVKLIEDLLLYQSYYVGIVDKFMENGFIANGIVYDTSTEDDINLNEAILLKIIDLLSGVSVLNFNNQKVEINLRIDGIDNVTINAKNGASHILASLLFDLENSAG